MAEPEAGGLYLDDLHVGDSYRTAEYVVSAQAILAFGAQFDPQVFHLDAEAASATFFGGLAASGWHTAAITMNLLVTSGLPFADGLIGAGAEVSWPTATRAGDVLHAEAAITQITPSRSRPDRGIVTVESRTLTANGEERQRLVARMLVFRRGATLTPR
ncbi:MaoC family dehydratase [Lacisediminihabitans sp.]|uniref:MaoC family dehydratase n=1 Tax=Lacisediminihabitans sp. TaxID=2787631 RepID=UPI00374D9DE3